MKNSLPTASDAQVGAPGSLGSSGVPRVRKARLVTIRRAAWCAVLVAVFLQGATVAVTYPRYQEAMLIGRERLMGSQIAATAFGDIEYRLQGNGHPVLIAHGAGGGYDQGLLIGETFVGDGFRFIAPSRFGYLKSSIPPDSSPVAQADAYAALLDRLDIGRVAVVAFSDGGPSALQFALRHPNRTAALIMMSAKSQTPPATMPLQEAVFESIFRSDYLYWAVSSVARSFLLSMLGVPADVQADTSSGAAPLVTQTVDGMHPISLRRNGIYNDRNTLSMLPEEVFRLEAITVPTLVVHAVDDGLQAYSNGLNTARRVPGAQLVSYERGGHLLSLHLDDARQKVAAFLAQHAN